MYEAHGTVYETKAEAIREAQAIANALRTSVYVWEVETGLPCAWIVAEIRMTEN
jgi:hypothetical protein